MTATPPNPRDPLPLNYASGKKRRLSRKHRIYLAIAALCVILILLDQKVRRYSTGIRRLTVHLVVTQSGAQIPIPNATIQWIDSPMGSNSPALVNADATGSAVLPVTVPADATITRIWETHSVHTTGVALTIHAAGFVDATISLPPLQPQTRFLFFHGAGNKSPLEVRTSLQKQ